MPAAANYDRHSHSGQSPLSQSPQNGGADTISTRSSRKKGKKAAVKEISPPETTSFADDILSNSPPQPTRRFLQGISEGGDGDKHNVKSPVLDALSNLEPELDFQSSFPPNNRWASTDPLGVSPPAEEPRPRTILESPRFAPASSPKPGFTLASPPVSPPQGKARPVSYGGQSSSSRQPSEKSLRYAGATPPFMQPPLPHLPQAHFYGAPDIDLGLRGGGASRREDGTVHFTALDRLSQTCNGSPVKSQDCLLVGSSNRLDVLSVADEKLKPAGYLAAISGEVIGATILPPVATPAAYSYASPLVVIIIHGPSVQPETHDPSGSEYRPLENDAESASQGPARQSNQGAEYRTRVEVHSLETQDRIATLFISQPSPTLPSFRAIPALAPPSVGDLTIIVDGPHIVLSSGSSGEVFIFRAAQEDFQCLAKLWTTVQSRELRKYSNSSNSADSDGSPTDLNRGQSASNLPILAVRGRWLVLAPPSPSRPSLHGIVPQSLLVNRVPGLDALNAPSKPDATCIIDSPDAESILNRVARGVAKEVVKGARWLGEQGMQTWNSYWNRETSPPQQTSSANRFQQPLEPVYPPGVFPPTHAPDSRMQSDEPEFVSIFDLEKLAHGDRQKAIDVIAPAATFQPPAGCSFLSLSPSGLTLLTATKKGDIQYIWDLMQISHTRVAGLVSNHPSSVDGDIADHLRRVRQIAKYARMSSSSIVDVVWTDPLGDLFAMLTRNGTIHVFDVPQIAFQWPPPRRVARKPQSPGLSPTRADEAEPPGGVFASAMKFAGKTQPILANLRGRAPSIGSTLGGMGVTGMGLASATSVRGGRAVAAGLSKSVGAASDTVSHLRHAGENRLHLQGLARDPRQRAMMWAQVRGDVVLVALDRDSARAFRIKRREPTGKQSSRIKVSVIDFRRPIDMKIPAIEQLSKLGEPNVSFWRFEPPASKQKTQFHLTHPLSHAEIETNAPYQPFHSDRRVNLSIYKLSSSSPAAEPNLMGESFTSSPSQLLAKFPESAATVHATTTPWVFGGNIPTTKLTIRSLVDDPSEDDDPTSALGAGHNSTIIRQAHSAQSAAGADEMIEQIVITTRRKKNRGNAQGTGAASGMVGESLVDEDGFFEDDCEVLDWAADRV